MEGWWELGHAGGGASGMAGLTQDMALSEFPAGWLLPQSITVASHDMSWAGHQYLPRRH